jgi:hypothetical protein
MQFTVKHLLGAMTFAGVACFSLIYATPWWGTLLFSGSVMLLFSAVLCAIFSQHRQRAVWLGVAIFGWGYYLFLCSPLLAVQSSPLESSWRMDGGPPFITTILLRKIYLHVLPLAHEPPKFDPSGRLINRSRYPSEIEYMQVGQSLCALLFAICGGWLGGQLYAHRQSQPADSGRPG